MIQAAEAIKKPLARDRSKVKRGFSGNIDRTGGDRGAGLIEGFSVITRGEALGHRMWCDSEFLQQVHDAINAAGDAGLKCRFTHPSLSGDGMGKFLGNLKNASLEGDQVFADLHFSESSHKTPDGDLAEYVMNLAEEDPDKFGSSIVFMHDSEAEEAFYVEHKNEDSGNFESPDPDNKKQYYHVRLQQLFGADIVDDPAANPGGLFHRGQEIAQEATQLMEYALDLEGASLPDLAQFDVDPDRVKKFFERFLDSHGLELTTKKEEEPMTDPKTSQQSEKTESQNAENKTEQSQKTEQTHPAGNKTEPSGRSEYAAELKQFTDAFGAENGTKWFTEPKSFSEAQTEYIGVLKQQLAAKDEEIKGLQEKLSSIDTGETQAFESQNGEGKDGKGGKDGLRNCFNIARRSKN